MKRIDPIDGLRAFAAFGVIWIHSWMFFNNPQLNVFSIDFYKIMAIVGNGVDFFFVISGFCMYLMIDKNSFSISKYCHFLYRRFLRIAPAFFLSVIVYATLIRIDNPNFPFWYNVFFHFLFLNNVVTGNVISGPFWSIGVEWHFYMILPLIVFLTNRISVIKGVIVLSILSLLLFSIATYGALDVKWWGNQVVTRIPEFGSGIIAAYLFLKNGRILNVFNGGVGLFIGLGVMFLGRFMMYTPFLTRVGSLAFIFKAISYTVMTSGFAFILYHVITERSFLSRLLSGKVITYFGRISYSIYLWHSLSFIILWKYLILLRPSPFNVIVVFVLISFLTIIFAHFSYRYIESFYFKKTDKYFKRTSPVYAKRFE